MPPKKAQTAGQPAQNTRFGAKRRPVVNADIKKKLKLQKIKEEDVVESLTSSQETHLEQAVVVKNTTIEDEDALVDSEDENPKPPVANRENCLVHAVIPSYWVESIDPLVTEDPTEVEHHIKKFKDDVDYEIIPEIHRDLADVLVRECINTRETLQSRPVHYCVFPSPGPEVTPFITCNPRIAREVAESDPKASVLSGYTLEEAKRTLQKYIAAFTATLTKAALLHPDEKDDGRTMAVNTDEVENSAGQEGAVLTPDMQAVESYHASHACIDSSGTFGKKEGPKVAESDQSVPPEGKW
jgi:hypothetical protein